jgi:hypothetical protein
MATSVPTPAPRTVFMSHANPADNEVHPLAQDTAEPDEVVPSGNGDVIDDEEEAMARVRELFTTGGPRGRDRAIRELAEALSYGRVGRRVRERMDGLIRAAARHMGFRRTGSEIRKASKSAINGAIRRAELEYEGDWIRRPR